MAACENAISAAALHLCEGGHKALFDVRTTLGLSVAELAMRASLTEDDIECIEEGGTEPTVPLLRRRAAALNADVHLTAGHDLGSVWFETHAA
ncbi:MAG: helix-turn-helix transcriptional regulator [Trebonia sp.]